MRGPGPLSAAVTQSPKSWNFSFPEDRKYGEIIQVHMIIHFQAPHGIRVLHHQIPEAKAAQDVVVRQCSPAKALGRRLGDAAYSLQFKLLWEAKKSPICNLIALGYQAAERSKRTSNLRRLHLTAAGWTSFWWGTVSETMIHWMPLTPPLLWHIMKCNSQTTYTAFDI